MRDDGDGDGLGCTNGYATTPLWARVLLYLASAQAGNKKHLETLPPVLTRSLQSQALNEEISSLQLHSREEPWQAFAVHAAGVQETEPDVLGYQAVLPAHLNPDLAAVSPPPALGRQAPLSGECRSSCSAPLYSW